MKVCVITCYESNEERMGFVLDACTKKGYEVIGFTSNFSHIRKEKRNKVPEKYKTVNTRPYQKNLSLGRILSHIRFSKDVFACVEKEKPDLIWLMAPANSLIAQAKKYKKKHPNTKLIIDIIDMWPESLPIKVNKNGFPFSIWKNIRTKNIDCCDALVTECSFYHEILKNEYPGQITTIYWARDEHERIINSNLSDEPFSLCYIGSINNLIDIDRFVEIVKGINVPIVFHVIGEGENTSLLLEELGKQCDVIYHGAIRDPKEKADIFSKCHAGVNVYKEGLYIGLTVKCIDYFEHGLPIINNIKGDTWRFVEEEDVGINYDGSHSIDVAKLLNLRMNNGHILKLFHNNFTKDVFIKKCIEVMDGVMK